ncbi:MAG TPA: MBL fold metallo-hydrolase [Clostridiales bacterium]|nr:MBL fold metallo-hydrolase [Clostridiales bacterium]
MDLTFLGAAREVTGSCTLIRTDDLKLLVDCGLFQGPKVLEELNRQSFGFDPSEIDFVLLTHAHIDHSGRIPKLVKDGFKGSIICTSATADLLDIMLKDSGHIQEMEAEWQTRKNLRAGLPPQQPLYTVQDAEEAMKHVQPVLYGQIISLNDRVTVRFADAGHILGSAIIELWIREGQRTTKLVFSGDLGSQDRPIIRNPEIIDGADLVIMESTYGDRLHQNPSTDMKRFLNIINNTCRRGGTVVIPSFAVGRTQEIIYELNKYYDHFEKAEVDEFLSIPVYIDSPLAVSATNIFKRHSDCFNAEARDFILKGDNPLEFPKLKLVKTVEESKALNEDAGSKIIISASGMCDAGRIKHHLKHNLWREESSIIFVGYQAQGTLGRIIKDGASSVKIYGEEIAVRAEVHSLEGFSAHADQKGLLDWIGAMKHKPKKVFLVHGEQEALDTLAGLLREQQGLDVEVPDMGQVYDVDGYQSGRADVGVLRSMEQLKELRENIDQLKYEFYVAMQRLEGQTGLGQEAGKLEELVNKLIQLQKNISDLNMIINSKTLAG